MKVTIKEASERDIKSIVAIENDSFSCPWSEKSFLDALHSPVITVYIAEDEYEKLLAYTCVSSVAGEAELLNIAVDSSVRGKGIGTEILDYSLRKEKDKQTSSVFLEVRESNTTAKHLYEKFGFRPFFVRKNYYTNPTEDAILMKFNLSESIRGDQ